MKNGNNVTKAKGFTIPELLVVIVIVGILGTLAAKVFSGHIEKSEATQISSIISSVDSEVKALSKTHRLGNCASSSRLVLAGNSILDVIHSGEDYVASAMKVAYQNEPKANLSKGLNQVTLPSAGTAGTYAIGKYPLTVQTCTTTENIYRIENVPTDVLKALLYSDYKDLANGFVATSAVTTGPLRYTAADANSEHQVNFYMKR